MCVCVCEQGSEREEGEVGAEGGREESERKNERRREKTKRKDGNEDEWPTSKKGNEKTAIRRGQEKRARKNVVVCWAFAS